MSWSLFGEFINVGARLIKLDNNLTYCVLQVSSIEMGLIRIDFDSTTNQSKSSYQTNLRFSTLLCCSMCIESEVYNFVMNGKIFSTF